MNNIFQDAIGVKLALPANKRFTLVGGCFDLLHVGHIHLLEYAASLEELLVVAVLSDSYCKKYKDPLQPIINQEQRLKMVASLRCVDFVFLCEVSSSSVEILEILRPNTVVFGQDSSTTQKLEIRLRNIASAASSTTVRYLPRYDKEEISTTYIVNKIRSGQAD